jgi:hypothetical protein
MANYFPAVDTRELLGFLGRAPQERAFDAWLDRHGIVDRPHDAAADSEADDADEAYENARASEIEDVERHSLCLIYEEADNFERLFGYAPDGAEFVLKQVALYAKGVQDYPGYAGELPLGLRFGMRRNDVLASLGEPTASRVIHELPADLYLSQQAAINVSYAGDGGSVGIVHVRPTHVFDRRALGLAEVEIDERAVDLEQLIACLGRSAYDEDLEALLEPMGWRSSDFDMADCDEVPALISRHGLALYYRNAAEFPALRDREIRHDGSLFAGFRVNRRGDLVSDGYAGRLPHGIQFHDAPERVIERVGRAPDWRLIDLDTGSFKWKLPHYTLHVMFSLIDYQVYRVSCFAKFLEPEMFARRYD